MSAALAVVLAIGAVTGCGAQPAPDDHSAAATPPAVGTATLGATPSPTLSPTPTQRPTPTPAPTPRFTNPPDPELAALIPPSAAGAEVVVVPVEDFALTPGDVGAAYGDIGVRFKSLAIAYVAQPATALFAMRVGGRAVSTSDLEPHLETAGRYVGVAGLHREPWREAVVGGHGVWVRPGDVATGTATRIYTWASGEFVFLLIGADDRVNQALVAGLPGEPPPPAATAGPSPAEGG